MGCDVVFDIDEIFKILKNVPFLTTGICSNGHVNQIVYRNSGNLYSISPLFPCSNLLSPPPPQGPQGAKLGHFVIFSQVRG